MNHFTIPIHVPGSLSADLDIRFTAPFDFTIEHVSAVTSNDSDATIKIGTSSDDDEFLEECVVGDSQVPVEKGRTDFVDDQFPRIEDGDVVVISVDYDGGSGTAGDDLTIVLTCAKG